MKKIPATLSIITAFAAVFQAGSALAQPAAPVLAVSTAAAVGQAQCAALDAPAGKTDPLLGQPSQLELLRRQQGATTGAIECSRLALPKPGDAAQRAGRGPLGAEDFLASKRLPIARTSFDGAWERVLAAALPRSAAARFAGLSASAGGERLLAAVNAYANGHIRYVEDRTLYGRADYWADAAATLARGAGDCEDIAIAKLQLLAAAGVPKDDMYLTIARDPVRRADHAVLVVRLQDRFWLLDNTSDRVVDAAPGYDYRPIFSLSGNRRWLHGA